MQRSLCWVKTEIQVDIPSPLLLPTTSSEYHGKNKFSVTVTYLVQTRYPATSSDSSLEQEFIESSSNLLIMGVWGWM